MLALMIKLIEEDTMTSWSNLLKDVIGHVGGVGMRDITDALDKLEKNSDEPWKRALLEMLGDAVAEYGWDGIKMAQDAVEKLAEGKIPEMDFVSLRARSDILAALQNEEADAKSKAKEFFCIIGESLGILLKAIIGGLLKG